MSKRKFIEDAALVIDGRVAALEAEVARDRERNPAGLSLSSDIAAIQEARHLARLIRSLKIGTYRDPYKAACEPWPRRRQSESGLRR